MFEGFDRAYISANGVRLHVRMKGEGPPLLLLHGFPQTGAMWHTVAPALAETHAVVVPDLRGYGDSSKVEGSADHAEYSKRTMAADMAALMRSLGHERFAVVGHDRGGRVTHRLCLDHAERVEKACVIDIIPTHTFFQVAGAEHALTDWHWFFLAQPRPLVERLIAAEPDLILETFLGGWGTAAAAFHPYALSEYRRCIRDPGTIHAMAEDYRAGASIDRVHDEADLDARITCPLLVMWGTRSQMHDLFDLPQTWRWKALDIHEAPIDAGHFLVEEKPDAVLAALKAFL